MCCINTWQITTSSAGNENLLHNIIFYAQKFVKAIMKIYIFYIKNPNSSELYKAFKRGDSYWFTCRRKAYIRKRKRWPKTIWMVQFCSSTNGILQHTSEASLPRKRPRYSECTLGAGDNNFTGHC